MALPIIAGVGRVAAGFARGMGRIAFRGARVAVRSADLVSGFFGGNPRLARASRRLGRAASNFASSLPTGWDVRWVGPTPTEELRGRVREELNQELQAVAAAALSGVVHQTPERTGFAKGNWHVGRNRSSSEMTGRVRGERETVADGERVIAGAEIGDRVHIFNNVPYIDKLEDGRSNQAPVGMVAVTAASIEAMIR